MNSKKIFPILLVIFVKISINANDGEMLFSVDAVLNNNSFGNLKHHSQDLFGSGLMSEYRFKQGEFNIVNQMFLSRDWDSAKKGGGKKIKGFYGYTNLGYLEFKATKGLLKHEWKFGRYYLDHGFSRMSDLLVSHDSRPFDGFLWDINYKNIYASMNAIQLEKIQEYERYLTIHSLKIDLNKNISILFSEASLYSTKNGGFNWQLLNPVIFWIPERENYPILKANGLLYFGFSYSIRERSSIYYEILIDDFQINKKSKGDLEPNEFGYVLGLNFTDWFSNNFHLWMEYTKITNRTYQSFYEEEIYTHRGFPIGHYMGNDFDLLHINISKKIINDKLKPYFSLLLHRDGFNGMDTPFDEPWLGEDVTLEGGYSEPFPTKPFTKNFETELAVDYSFSDGSRINLGLRYKKNNLDNDPILEIVTRLKFKIGKIIKY